jgi:hypothetical protein
VTHADEFFGAVYAGQMDLGLLGMMLSNLARPWSHTNPKRERGPNRESSSLRKLPSLALRVGIAPVAAEPPEAAMGDAHHTVEIGLHPGEAAAESPESQADGWHDPLASVRPRELQMLVSGELVDLLERSGWRLGRIGKSRDGALHAHY